MSKRISPLAVRMTQDLKDAVRDGAEAVGMNPNAFVCQVLRKAIEDIERQNNPPGEGTLPGGLV